MIKIRTITIMYVDVNGEDAFEHIKVLGGREAVKVAKDYASCANVKWADVWDGINVIRYQSITEDSENICERRLK